MKLPITPKIAVYRGRTKFYVKSDKISHNKLTYQFVWNGGELLVFLKKVVFERVKYDD